MVIIVEEPAGTCCVPVTIRVHSIEVQLLVNPFCVLKVKAQTWMSFSTKKKGFVLYPQTSNKNLTYRSLTFFFSVRRFQYGRRLAHLHKGFPGVIQSIF